MTSEEPSITTLAVSWLLSIMFWTVTSEAPSMVTAGAAASAIQDCLEVPTMVRSEVVIVTGLAEKYPSTPATSIVSPGDAASTASCRLQYGFAAVPSPGSGEQLEGTPVVA